MGISVHHYPEGTEVLRKSSSKEGGQKVSVFNHVKISVMRLRNVLLLDGEFVQAAHVRIIHGHYLPLGR